MSTNPVMDTSLTGRRRNRSWSPVLKREIVAASYVPGASVAAVARRYEANANQVFAWRKLFPAPVASPRETKMAEFVPVTLIAESGGGSVSGPAPCAAIEIGLPGGYRVRVDRDVTAASLRRVLDVLERR